MNKGSSDKEIQEIFEDFIQYSKAKNLAERTIGYYENNYKRFKRFLEAKSITMMNQVDNRLIQQFTLHLQTKIDNAKSINTILRAIRSFLYYAMKLDYLFDFKVQLLKEEETIKEVYTDKELELLLEKPNINNCNFAEYRNWLMVNFFLGTGSRLRTVRNLKIEDLDFENGYIRLNTTKSRKQQIIPLSKHLSKIVQEYLQYRGGEPDDWLFPTVYGKRFTTDGAGQAIRNYNRRRGVNKTSIHLFRHTFAKRWILAGGDIFRLQKILGHSDISIVKEYVNLWGHDLKKDFDKFNPLEQIVDNCDYIRIK